MLTCCRPNTLPPEVSAKGRYDVKSIKTRKFWRGLSPKMEWNHYHIRSKTNCHNVNSKRTRKRSHRGTQNNMPGSKKGMKSLSQDLQGCAHLPYSPVVPSFHCLMIDAHMMASSKLFHSLVSDAHMLPPSWHF